MWYTAGVINKAALVLVFTLVFQACAPVALPETGATPAVKATQVQPVVIDRETDPLEPIASTEAASSTSLVVGAPPVRDVQDPNLSTPAKKGCVQAAGRVEKNNLTSLLLPDPLDFRVYLPPCYDEDTSRSYPVLYLIHGQSYTDSQWDDLGVPETADQMISSGEVGPFIVIMPRDRVWTEPNQDNFGQAVIESLVPWVDEHYRTIPDRAHRAIGGLSRGAAWAANLAFSHWELFGAVGMHSGFVFHTDFPFVEQWLKNIPDGQTPRIYMDLGNGDREEITSAATWLERMLTTNGIPHEWHLFVGEHQDAYWGAHVGEYLHFYTAEWGDDLLPETPFSAINLKNSLIR